MPRGASRGNRNCSADGGAGPGARFQTRLQQARPRRHMRHMRASEVSVGAEGRERWGPRRLRGCGPAVLTAPRLCARHPCPASTPTPQPAGGLPRRGLPHPSDPTRPSSAPTVACTVAARHGTCCPRSVSAVSRPRHGFLKIQDPVLNPRARPSIDTSKHASSRRAEKTRAPSLSLSNRVFMQDLKTFGLKCFPNCSAPELLRNHCA